MKRNLDGGQDQGAVIINLTDFRKETSGGELAEEVNQEMSEELSQLLNFEAKALYDLRHLPKNKQIFDKFDQKAISRVEEVLAADGFAVDEDAEVAFDMAEGKFVLKTPLENGASRNLVLEDVIEQALLEGRSPSEENLSLDLYSFCLVLDEMVSRNITEPDKIEIINSEAKILFNKLVPPDGGGGTSLDVAAA